MSGRGGGGVSGGGGGGLAKKKMHPRRGRHKRKRSKKSNTEVVSAPNGYKLTIAQKDKFSVSSTLTSNVF